MVVRVHPQLIASHSVLYEVKPQYIDLEPSLNLGEERRNKHLAGLAPERRPIKLQSMASWHLSNIQGG